MRISIQLKSTSSVHDIVDALKLLVAILSLLNTLGSEFSKMNRMLQPLKTKLIKAKQKEAIQEQKLLPNPDSDIDIDALEFNTSMSSNKSEVKRKLLDLLDRLIVKLTRMGADFVAFISALHILRKRVEEYAL